MSSTKYELKPGDTVAVSVLEERTEVEINIADVPEPKPDPNTIFDVFEIGETHAGVRCTYTNPVSETSTKDSWVNIFPAGYEPTVHEVQQGKWALTNEDGDFEFLGTFVNLEPGQPYVCWAYVQEGQGFNFLDNGDGFTTLPEELEATADITVERVGQWMVEFNVTLSGNVPSGGELSVWADLESTGEVEEIGIVEFLDVSLESPYPGKIEGLRKDTPYILRWDYEVDGVIYDGEGPTVKTGGGDPGPDPEPEPEPEPEAYYKHTTPESAAFVSRDDHAHGLWSPGYEKQPVIFQASDVKPVLPTISWDQNYLPDGWHVDPPQAEGTAKIWQATGFPRTPNSTHLEWDRVEEYDGAELVKPENSDHKFQKKWGMNLRQQEGAKQYKPWPTGTPFFHFAGKDSTIDGAIWEDVRGGANGMIPFADGSAGIYRMADHYWLANPFDFESRPEAFEFPDGLPDWLRYNHLTGCFYKDDALIRIQSGMPDEIFEVPVKAMHGARWQESVLQIRLMAPKLLFGVGGDFDPTAVDDPTNIMRQYCEAVNVKNTETPVFILPGEYRPYQYGVSQYLGKTAGDRFYIGYDPEGLGRRPKLIGWHKGQQTEYPDSLPSNGNSVYGRLNTFANLEFGGTGNSGSNWRAQTLVNCIAAEYIGSGDVLQTGGHNDGAANNNVGPSSAIRWRCTVAHGGMGNTKHLDYNRGMGSHRTIVEECHYHSARASINLKQHCTFAVIINNLFQSNVPATTYDEFVANDCADQILNMYAGAQTLFAGNVCEVTHIKRKDSTKSRGPTEFIQFDQRRPKWGAQRPVFGSKAWNRQTFDSIHAKGINNPYNDGLVVILVDDNLFRYRVIEDIPFNVTSPSDAVNKPVCLAKLVPSGPAGVWRMFKRQSVYGDPQNGDPNPVEAGLISDWSEIDILNDENTDRSAAWWFGQTLYVVTDNNRLEVIDGDRLGVPVDKVIQDDPKASESDLASRRYIERKLRILPNGNLDASRVARESDPGYWPRWPRPRVINMSAPEIEQFLSRGW